MNTKEATIQKLAEVKNQAAFARNLGFELTAQKIEEDVEYYNEVLENCKKVQNQNS